MNKRQELDKIRQDFIARGFSDELASRLSRNMLRQKNKKTKFSDYLLPSFVSCYPLMLVLSIHIAVSIPYGSDNESFIRNFFASFVKDEGSLFLWLVYIVCFLLIYFVYKNRKKKYKSLSYLEQRYLRYKRNVVTNRCLLEVSNACKLSSLPALAILITCVVVASKTLFSDHPIFARESEDSPEFIIFLYYTLYFAESICLTLFAYEAWKRTGNKALPLTLLFTAIPIGPIVLLLYFLLFFNYLAAEIIYGLIKMILIVFTLGYIKI